MSSTIIHVVASTILYLIITLIGELAFSIEGLLLMIIGGTVLDLDHIFYFLKTTRPLTRETIAKRLREDYNNQTPHFYLFHNIETIILFFVLWWAFPYVSFFYFLFIGWLAHCVVDVASYIFHYRSLHPWAPFWSVLFYSVWKSRQE